MRHAEKDATSQSEIIRIVDDTTGAPVTTVTFETASLALWYRVAGGAKVAITAATLAAVDSAYSAGGIIHISDGYYRLDPPNAAYATAGMTVFGGSVPDCVVVGTSTQINPPANMTHIGGHKWTVAEDSDPRMRATIAVPAP